ncbi:MAG: hypothetical protein A2542_01365 [Parcubacteria group bacterium RIFOXYD2_FULL_52_8]|nr:MAG: hypothetical protein A2542_01365 [Parcubacteria group bacterium RIFOXYD2_FULL_52_8]
MHQEARLLNLVFRRSGHIITMNMKVIGIIVAALVIILIAFYMNSSNGTPTTPAGTPESTATPSPAANGLQVQDVVVGTGTEAKAGDTVSVHYTGTLENGTKFDSSVDRGQPFRFPLGAGMVIQGWDLGVAGMKEGGKRHLVIPASLAYGAASPSPLIPANSTLVFDVELIKVERAN